MRTLYSEIKDPINGPLYEVQTKHYLQTAWKIFKLYPLGFIGFSVIELVSVIACIILSSSSPLFGLLLEAAISPLHVGILIVGAQLLQRQSCAFKDFFLGFHYYKPLVIIGLLFGIISEIDKLFPGQTAASILTLTALIMLSVVYFFAPFLIFDRRLDWWEALETSRKTVQRRLMRIFGLNLILGLILNSGIFALGVGVFITYPLVECAATVAYADIFGLQSQEY